MSSILPLAVFVLASLLLPPAQALRFDFETRSHAIHPPRTSGRVQDVVTYTADAEADRVRSLPGWGDLGELVMFAGYVTVDEAAGRALFYILVESEQSPAVDPVVLWLNGGPGCSSLGGGFMSELGPFFPSKDGKKLQVNPYAWNQAATTIFLDSPAFVGYSYSNTTSDLIVGDGRTAADSRLFLLGLMKKFPHLKANDLYISGESYAGHYVPNLARDIVRGNAAHGPSEQLNLKGFLVGNPWTDTAIDNLGAVDFWWHHALISDETALGIRSNCNFSRIGPLDAHPSHANPQSKAELCDKFCNRAFSELGPINIYEIFADICLPRHALASASAMAAALGPSSPASLTARLAAKHTNSLASRPRLGEEVPYDPCVDDEVEVYLNLPEVQKALHANQTAGVLPWKWSDCNGLIQYSTEDLLSTVLPVYEELLATASLRILIYSGDVDGIVPVVGTRRWTAGLGLQTLKPWRPWFSNSQQVGGYLVEYEGLSFATVRNAGHMVPYVQPERMLHLFKAFLNDEAP